MWNETLSEKEIGPERAGRMYPALSVGQHPPTLRRIIAVLKTLLALSIPLCLPALLASEATPVPYCGRRLASKDPEGPKMASEATLRIQ